MNYTELVAAVASTTETTYDTADMNRFIEQAEKRIYVDVRFPILSKTDTLTMTTGVQYLDAPDDFLSVEYMAAITPVTLEYNFLLPKAPSFIRQAYPTVLATGAPKYYALYGPALTTGQPNEELRFLIGPTPDANYSTELQYFYYPESIVTAASGTTWLSENFSPLLLYAALVEAYVFLKGDADVMKMYQDKYADAVRLAKKLGEGLEKSDSYRNGDPRVAVK